MTVKYQMAVAVNNEEILAANLARSSAYSSLVSHVMRGRCSASAAFNEVLDSANYPYVIFVHQDVYLPQSWLVRLDALISRIESGPNNDWAVLGVAGVNRSGRIVGKLWSEGIQREINAGEEIEETVSLDEVLLVVNVKVGLRFDERLPGFHLYGTDIVQTALKAGKKCFVIRNPIVHNDRTKYFLDAGFKRAYKYMSEKWRDKLPITTTVTTIRANYFPVVWLNFRQTKRYILRKPLRRVDSSLLAKQLGYE